MAIDYDLIFGEGYDPCVALAALRPVIMRSIAGGSVQKTSFRDREVWFHPTDVKENLALIKQLEIDCAAKNNSGFGHSAITLGGGGRSSCRRRY